MLCAKCHQHNPDTARFCNQCGASLAPASAPEYRRLTLVFCDLVGSVALANQLDPEDWHALLGAYQAAAGDAIRRHHGYIAQRLGDGIVAYFGYPLASEDDATRAVAAALEVVSRVSAITVPRFDTRLQVRVGLHSGPTVMGHAGGSEGEYLAMGDTPNVASRIQAAAPVNSVVLSAATRTLVELRVRCVELGEFRLKGLAAPMRLYHARAMRTGEDDDRAVRGLSPFLGRERELGLLSRRWDEAAGAGRCVLLLGEPGIGKSRLAREVRALATRSEALGWTMRCSAHTANTPFAPLVQFLRQAMASTGAPEASASALATVLAMVGVTDEAVVTPLMSMLAIDAPQAGPRPELSAQAQRERTFTAVSAVLRTMAAGRRVLVVVEDLHWADPSTLEWLGRLLRRDLPAGLMLLLVARTEFEAPWPAGTRVESVSLQPCEPGDAAAMVVALDTGHVLGSDAIARIVDRAEGNPLFVEEFARAALEAQGDDIPLTLQAQTLARLDRLGPARQVLQQAAVIGRHFSRRQLQAVNGPPPELVDQALRRGVEAHMLRPLGDAGGDVYGFHHALLRDAAYSSLLRSARQASHARVAEVILADDPALAERQPELLAHHYTEAGQSQPAIAHWLAAGRRALARSACVEAATHARTALRLLGDPGENEAALALELELQLVLAPALMAVRGVLDPQVEQTYSRARLLCERLGNGPKLLVPLWGLWAYELMRGEVGRSLEVTRQLKALAQRMPTPIATLVAAATTGMTLFYQGDLPGARAECAKGLGQFRLAAATVGGSARGFHDPGVMCHAFHSLACWLLGDTDIAAEGATALRDVIPALAPFDAAYAWCSDAVLRTLSGDPPAACDASGRAIAIGREQAFPAWQLMGSMMDGWGRARQGDHAAALQQMQRSYAAWCAGGARNLRPFFLGLLADAWLAAGDAAQVVACAEGGLAEAATGERVWDAELHRLRAEGLSLLGDSARALDSAQTAVDTATRMGIRVWAMRAAETRERIEQRQRGAAT